MRALAALLVLFAAALWNSAAADVARPLLVEGKSALYQKIITRPGAVLAPDPTAAAAGEPLAPFTVLYVYNRSEQRVLVGRAQTGETIGWIEESQTIPWQQTIVVSFANPAGREPVLMFRSLDDVNAVLADADPAGRVRQLRDEAREGQTGPDRPVLAIEPETYVDIRERFYFFPILNHEERRLPGRGSGMVLQVASLSKFDAASSASREDALKNFNAGIVFVVDTTRSMGPYIAQLREAITQLQKEIGSSELGDKVRFGLIGFRQNPKITPNIEYQVKSFLKLDKDSTADRFVEAIGGMTTAEISTATFREDALGGVHEALKDSDWEAFGARLLVVVSDAGPRLYDPALPEATLAGPLGVREINQMARDQGVEIFAMHLKTPEGASDHSGAEADYQKLAASASGGVNYVAIPSGDPRVYRRSVDALASSLTGVIKAAADGMIRDTPAPEAPADPYAEALLAMQLRYLGSAEGQLPPDVFKAWIVDKDLTDPTRQAVDVRVFLTKNQLSTLRQIGQVVVDKANGAITNPGDFFSQLRTAMALLARDPSLIVDTDPNSLGDALGEYLADLPYQSDVLRVTQEDWDRMGGGAQRQLIDGLQAKLAFYEDWHNTPANWTAPYEGAPDGEYVSALPLSQMP